MLLLEDYMFIDRLIYFLTLYKELYIFQTVNLYL